MWELLQKVLQEKITPNQLLLLYSLNEKISVPQINPHLELKGLIKEGYLEQTSNLEYNITREGKAIIRKYDNYFIKAKKKTNIQLMGKNFLDKLKSPKSVAFPVVAISTKFNTLLIVGL